MNSDTRNDRRPARRGQNGGGAERVFTCRDPAADKVLALVSAHADVPTALLLHPTRSHDPVVRARHMAMYLIHTSLSRTLTETGRYFGRDRTTVAHACARIEDRRDDAGFDAEVSALEARIGCPALYSGTLGTEPSHVRH